MTMEEAMKIRKELRIKNIMRDEESRRESEARIAQNRKKSTLSDEEWQELELMELRLHELIKKHRDSTTYSDLRNLSEASAALVHALGRIDIIRTI